MWAAYFSFQGKIRVRVAITSNEDWRRSKYVYTGAHWCIITRATAREQISHRRPMQWLLPAYCSAFFRLYSSATKASYRSVLRRLCYVLTCLESGSHKERMNILYLGEMLIIKSSVLALPLYYVCVRICTHMHPFLQWREYPR